MTDPPLLFADEVIILFLLEIDEKSFVFVLANIGS
jgi:hypothetical protein